MVLGGDNQEDLGSEMESFVFSPENSPKRGREVGMEGSPKRIPRTILTGGNEISSSPSSKPLTNQIVEKGDSKTSSASSSSSLPFSLMRLAVFGERPSRALMAEEVFDRALSSII